ncbi:hypothetical protein TUM20983_36830 [Mycobacterium antarcticum]|nr:hypothetical protein TUM20983_36830 [Mycolicibacterium sp. TUM20983]
MALFTTLMLDAGDASRRLMVAFMLSAAVDTHRHHQLPAPDHAAVHLYLTATVRGGIARGELGAGTDVAAPVTMLAALFWG